MLRTFFAGTLVGAALSGAFYFIVNQERVRLWFSAAQAESSEVAEQKRLALQNQFHAMTTLPEDQALSN